MDSISMSKVIALILAFSPTFLMVNIGESFNIKLLLITLSYIEPCFKDYVVTNEQQP